MVFNIYNKFQVLKCHYDCLSFLNPKMVCHLELIPGFNRPQDPPPTVQSWLCILPQGPLKLPTLIPIRRSFERDHNGLLCWQTLVHGRSTAFSLLSLTIIPPSIVGRSSGPSMVSLWTMLVRVFCTILSLMVASIARLSAQVQLVLLL